MVNVNKWIIFQFSEDGNGETCKMIHGKHLLNIMVVNLTLRVARKTVFDNHARSIKRQQCWKKHWHIYIYQRPENKYEIHECNIWYFGWTQNLSLDVVFAVRTTNENEFPRNISPCNRSLKTTYTIKVSPMLFTTYIKFRY